METGQDMVATVVVPLDGSELAEQALPWAQALAERNGATLRLVHIVDASTEFGAWSMGGGAAIGAEINEWLADGERYLAEAAARIGTSGGHPVETEVRLGGASHEMRDLLNTVPDPVVVMCSHGRSGVRRALLGSVAQRIVHDSPCPVLVLKMHEDGATTGTPAFDAVTIPLDGSAFGEHALDAIVDVLGEATSVHLVRIVELPTVPMSRSISPGMPLDYGLVEEYMSASKEEAIAYLQQMQQRLQTRNVTVTSEVREGRIATEILAAAEAQPADIIAMATHGRGGLTRLVVGSVAEQVLHETTRPLLLIRPQE